MNWYSWLSKTDLDPSFIYQYSLEFDRNQLQRHDIVHFNHDFLLSIGITVAKHRLQILKLAKKNPPSISSKFLLSIAKIKARVLRLVTPQKPTATMVPVEVTTVEKPPVVIRTRKKAKSGPLMMNGNNNNNSNNNNVNSTCRRSLKLSGPLDRTVQERLVFSYGSPLLSGPMNARGCSPKAFVEKTNEKLLYPRVKKVGDGDDDDLSVWSALFRDMKPT